MQMKNIYLVHLGIGNVGKQLVRLILENREKIRKKFGVDLQYCGLFNSKGGVFDPMGLSEDDLIRFPYSLNSDITNCLDKIPKPFILIDTTASDGTYSLLVNALKRGAGVVMSNKKPLCRSQQEFDLLVHSGKVKYETTVGAALPVISTLNNLVDTGDEILVIRGCFSGTLGFIFSKLEQGMKFSEAVAQAKDKGFTEPDPRDDLSGLDVARKALILSRTLGRKLELTDIKLESLYPDKMKELTVGEFLGKVNTLDNYYQEKMKGAEKANKTLRYMAELKNNNCRVGIKEVNRDEDLGNLRGPDNLIVFKTGRYYERPLVVKGPGAGAEITASGVFSDVLKSGGLI